MKLLGLNELKDLGPSVTLTPTLRLTLWPKELMGQVKSSHSVCN